MQKTPTTQKPRVVVIGAGFGGLAIARNLGGKDVDVTVLDRTNHHLFQPLLYQVATAGLSPANIAQPTRGILRGYKNVRVLMANITKIDYEGKKVIAGEAEYPYDHLVVATGARHSYFGHPEWETYAPGLKTLDDALEIRRRLLIAFEKAEACDDALERQHLLTFVIVGAGPTGVEMAGAISEIARETMVRDFRNIDPKETRVILLDAATRVLPVFDPKLSTRALGHLRELRVDVRLGVAVQDINEKGVTTASGFIPAKTVVWAAGNAASPLLQQLPGERDRAGRTHVTPELNIEGYPEIYVIGDAAHCLDKENKPLPGVSPVALQQGACAAKNILARIAGEPTEAFSYWNRGSMATIGRHRAVADIHVAKFGGFFAWMAWVFVHLVFLMDFRNRTSVFLIWTWSYFTWHQGARLITGRRVDDNPV